MSQANQRQCPVRGVWGVIVRFFRTVGTAYRRFGHTGSPLMAAAIAFYSVVCLGPLGILLSVALQTIFGKGSNTYTWVRSAVAEFGDVPAQQVMNQVDGLLARPDLFTSSALGVLALVWAGLRLFETVERSLTEVWPGKILRGFFGRKLISLLMMAVAGVLLTMFVVANAFYARLHGLLQQLHQQFPEIDPNIVAQAQPRVMVVFGFLLALLAFSLMYKYMPVRPVPKRAALAGAVCAAALWQAASPVFLYFISRSAHNNAMYGGLAGVVVFSMWAFLGAQVLLFGAHFAAAWQDVFLGGEGAAVAMEDADSEAPE